MSLLGLSLFQQALAVGSFIGLTCGLVGAYIVVKRLTFLCGSVSHSAFGGVGAAFLFGVSPFLGALLSGALSSFIITYIHFYHNQDEDSLIGAVWAIGMAIGLFCLYFVTDYIPNVNHYIFGSVLMSTPLDIVMIVCFSIFLLILFYVFGPAFQSISFDPQGAEVINLPVKRLHFFLLLLVSLSTIVVMKLIGIMLVMALLILPAAAALRLSSSFFRLQLLSILFSIFSTVFGILLSFRYDLPTGPCIILICSTIFLLSLFKRK